MWNDVTLCLRSDLTADEEKVFIEAAKLLIGSEDFQITTREDLPWQAQLTDHDGHLVCWDSQLFPFAARLTVSNGDEDNDYRINAIIFKPH
jgi:hypothetical protein